MADERRAASDASVFEPDERNDALGESTLMQHQPVIDDDDRDEFRARSSDDAAEADGGAEPTSLAAGEPCVFGLLEI